MTGGSYFTIATAYRMSKSVPTKIVQHTKHAPQSGLPGLHRQACHSQASRNPESCLFSYSYNKSFSMVLFRVSTLAWFYWQVAVLSMVLLWLTWVPMENKVIQTYLHTLHLEKC